MGLRREELGRLTIALDLQKHFCAYRGCVNSSTATDGEFRCDVEKTEGCMVISCPGGRAAAQP
jgi:hypothetical protein